MVIAALGDIHGHWPALESVLQEIDAAGIQTIVHTGDCVGGVAWPNECIETLKARRIFGVCGEYDRLTARYLRHSKGRIRKVAEEAQRAIEQAFMMTRSENLEYLRGLPNNYTLTADGIEVLVCHGSPGNPNAPLSASTVLEHFRRQRELTTASIIVCGQTHDPYYTRVDGTLFVNPGAVFRPEQPEAPARYAIIDTEEEPWRVELRCVSRA